MSKPLRLRGLKCPMFLDVGIDELVEALAASWIEIICDTSANKIYHVEALAASWIEIRYYAKLYHPDCVEALAASWIEILTY